MEISVIQENTRSRQRLESLIDRLTEETLLAETGEGWTVGALLAHLAFWDQRVLALMRRWKNLGKTDESPVDADAMNEAVKPLCLALDGVKATALCLIAAKAVDTEIEGLAPELEAQIKAEVDAGRLHFRFNRALHRLAHLADIKRALHIQE